jgi:hypothetical protein
LWSFEEVLEEPLPIFCPTNKIIESGIVINEELKPLKGRDLFQKSIQKLLPSIKVKLLSLEKFVLSTTTKSTFQNKTWVVLGQEQARESCVKKLVRTALLRGASGLELTGFFGGEFVVKPTSQPQFITTCVSVSILATL